MLHLQCLAVVAQLILEDLAVHDVLVLVDQARSGVGTGRLRSEQVEVLSAIFGQRVGEDKAVECLGLHGINVRVHVQLDLQMVALGRTRDSRHYISITSC